MLFYFLVLFTFYYLFERPNEWEIFCQLVHCPVGPTSQGWASRNRKQGTSSHSPTGVARTHATSLSCHLLVARTCVSRKLEQKWSRGSSLQAVTGSGHPRQELNHHSSMPVLLKAGMHVLRGFHTAVPGILYSIFSYFLSRVLWEGFSQLKIHLRPFFSWGNESPPSLPRSQVTWPESWSWWVVRWVEVQCLVS